MKTKPAFVVPVIAALLQTAPLRAQVTNPPYLRDMPSVERVKAEIKGSDPVDVSARQIGAFQRLQDIIKTLAGPRFSSNEFTPDESRLIGRYFNAWQRYLYKDNSPPPQDQARWQKLRAFYETDPKLLNEVLQRFFSAEFRSAYYEATGKQPLKAESPQPSAQASASPSVQPSLSGAPDAKAYLAEGEKYLKSGEPAKASVAYRKAVALDPSLVPAYWGIAATAGDGEAQIRIAALKQITILEPSDYQAFLNLGVFYIHAGQYKDGVAPLQQALRLRPNSAEASNQLGIAYSSLRQTAAAIAALKEAIRLNPNFASPHHNLGSLYVYLKRNQEAVSELSTAIRLAPKYAYSYTSLGIAYARMGRKNDALQVYKKLQMLDKAEAQKLYEEINKPTR